MKGKFFKASFIWKETFDALIEINYLAIIFLVPLYFSILFPTYNMFELNKLIIFKSLTWLLLLFTGLKLVFYSRSSSLKNIDYKHILKLFKSYWLLPFIFIAGLSITLFFSIDIAQSFFGSYDRQEGLVSYLFYFIWFALLLINLKSANKQKTDKKINNIIIVSTISAFLVALYGVLQILNIDFLTWSVSPFLDRRVTSTLGQPNFLASYLLLVIPLSCYLLIKSSKFYFKFLLSLIVLVQILCLFFTASRGALLALFFVGVISFLFLWFRTRINVLKKIFVVLGFLIAIFIGIFSLEYISSGRISSAFNLQYGSSAVRMIFYKVAITAISERPFFGYGLENSSEIFVRYYQPSWGIFGDVGSTTDRAHNLFLDILLNGGIFALIIFSLLYYQYFYLAKRNLKKEGAYSLSLFLFAGVAAYLISLLFSFTIITGEIYLWLYLALLSAIGMSNERSEISIKHLNISAEEVKTKGRMFFVFFSIIASILLTSIVYYGINIEKRTLMADYYFNKLYYTLAQKKYFDTIILNNYLLAERPNVINQIFYDQFLAAKLSEFYPSITELSPKYIVRLELEKIDRYLSSVGYKNILAHGEINGALGDINSAQEYFSALKKISPNWPFLYSAQGQALFLNKQYQAAINSYLAGLSNLPDAEDQRLMNNNEKHKENVSIYYYMFNREIANSYFSMYDYKQAEIYFQKAYRYNLSDFTLLKKIADTYYLRSNLNEAIKYNEYGFKRNPDDYHWSLALSVLYYENNNQFKASEYLRRAIELAPDNDEVKSLQSQYNRH